MSILLNNTRRERNRNRETKRECIYIFIQEDVFYNGAIEIFIYIWPIQYKERRGSMGMQYGDCT